MMKKYSIAAGVLCAAIVMSAGEASSAGGASAFEAFAGSYVVVAVRQNSLVAAPGGMRPGPADSPIGKSVEFTSSGVVMEGIGCDDWRADATAVPVDFAEDRLLADLRLPPTDSPLSAGDKRLSRSFRISCEGEYFTTLYQADRRVVALSWANAQQYLILERPLNTAEVGRLQKALTSTKFYSGEVNGTFDAGTERAVRAWYEYRLADPNAAIPRRPAITENLLDALKVLN